MYIHTYARLYACIYVYVCIWRFLVPFFSQKTKVSNGPQLQSELWILIAPGWRRVFNPTLWDFCVSMIGSADIEASKSTVALNASLPQGTYPCGNFLTPLAEHFSDLKDR